MQSLNCSREKTEMRLKTYFESSLRRSMGSLHVIIFFPNSYSLKVLRVEKVLIISSFKSVTGWNKSEKPTAVPVLNNNNVRTEIKVDIQVRCLMIFISNLYHKEGTCSTGLTWHDFFLLKMESWGVAHMCFVHYQGQNSGQKHTTENFLWSHIHSSRLTMKKVLRIAKNIPRLRQARAFKKVLHLDFPFGKKARCNIYTKVNT